VFLSSSLLLVPISLRRRPLSFLQNKKKNAVEVYGLSHVQYCDAQVQQEGEEQGGIWVPQPTVAGAGPVWGSCSASDELPVTYNMQVRLVKINGGVRASPCPLCAELCSYPPWRVGRPRSACCSLCPRR